MLMLVHVAPTFRLSVLEPEYHSGRVGLHLFAIRHNQRLAIGVENLHCIVFVADGALVKGSLNPIVS